MNVSLKSRVLTAFAVSLSSIIAAMSIVFAASASVVVDDFDGYQAPLFSGSYMTYGENNLGQAASVETTDQARSGTRSRLLRHTADGGSSWGMVTRKTFDQVADVQAFATLDLWYYSASNDDTRSVDVALVFENGTTYSLKTSLEPKLSASNSQWALLSIPLVLDSFDPSWDTVNFDLSKLTVIEFFVKNNGAGPTNVDLYIDDVRFVGVNTVERPQNLISLIGSEQIGLAWDVTESASGYRIYRTTDAQDTPGASDLLVTLDGADTTIFYDTSATNGQVYRYWVTAIEGTAESDFSDSVLAGVNFQNFTGDNDQATLTSLEDILASRARAIIAKLYHQPSGAQASYMAPIGGSGGVLTDYGRVWVYDAGIALSLAVHEQDGSSAARAAWLQQNMLDIPESRPNLPERVLFAGWPFSKNQIRLGDGWEDPRNVTGANAWALYGIAEDIVSGSGGDPAFFSHALEGILYHTQDNGLVTAGWTIAALRDAYQNPGLSYNQILSFLGDVRTLDDLGNVIDLLSGQALLETISELGSKLLSYALGLVGADFQKVRSNNIVLEHNIDLLALLNYTLENYASLNPSLSYEELNSIRLELRDAMFSHLYNEAGRHFITGMSADGVPSQHVAIDNSTWLSSALNLDELRSDPEKVSMLSDSLEYTVQNFTRNFQIQGKSYFGAHYFLNDFEDAYIEDGGFDQSSIFHIEATCGLILGLQDFADAFPDDPNTPLFRATALALWKDIQRYIHDIGFLYGSQSIPDLFEPLEGTVSAVWYLNTLRYFRSNPGSYIAEPEDEVELFHFDIEYRCDEGEMVHKIEPAYRLNSESASDRIGLGSFKLGCGVLTDHHEDVVDPIRSTYQIDKGDHKHDAEPETCEGGLKTGFDLMYRSASSESIIDIESQCYLGGPSDISIDQRALSQAPGTSCENGQVLVGVRGDYDRLNSEYQNLEAICSNLDAINVYKPSTEGLDENVRLDIPRGRVRRQCDGRLNMTLDTDGGKFTTHSDVFKSVGKARTAGIAKNRARRSIKRCVQQWFEGNIAGHIGDCTNNGVWAAGKRHLSADANIKDFQGVIGHETLLSEYVLDTFSGIGSHLASCNDAENQANSLAELKISLELRKKDGFTNNDTSAVTCPFGSNVELTTNILNPLCGQPGLQTDCVLSEDEVGPGKSGLCNSVFPQFSDITPGTFVDTDNDRIFIADVTDLLWSPNHRYSLSTYREMVLKDHTPSGQNNCRLLSSNQLVACHTLTEIDSIPKLPKTVWLADGELVVLDSQNARMWDSGTGGSGANYVLLKDDGHLYLNCIDGQSVWTTNQAIAVVHSCGDVSVESLIHEIGMAEKEALSMELLCPQDGPAEVDICPSRQAFQFLDINGSSVTLTNSHTPTLAEHLEDLSNGRFTPTDLFDPVDELAALFVSDVFFASEQADLVCASEGLATFEDTPSTNGCFDQQDQVLPESLYDEIPDGGELHQKYGSKNAVWIANIRADSDKEYIVNVCHLHRTNEYYTDTPEQVQAAAAQGVDHFKQRYFPRVDCQLDRTAEEGFVGQYSEYKNLLVAGEAGALQGVRTAAQLAAFAIAEALTDGAATALIDWGFLDAALARTIKFGVTSYFTFEMAKGIIYDIVAIKHCDSHACVQKAATDLAIQGLFVIDGLLKSNYLSFEEPKKKLADAVASSMLNLGRIISENPGQFGNLNAAARLHYRLSLLSGVSKDFKDVAEHALRQGGLSHPFIEALIDLPDEAFIDNAEFVQYLLTSLEAITAGDSIDESKLETLVKELSLMNEVLQEGC